MPREYYSPSSSAGRIGAVGGVATGAVTLLSWAFDILIGLAVMFVVLSGGIMLLFMLWGMLSDRCKRE